MSIKLFVGPLVHKIYHFKWSFLPWGNSASGILLKWWTLDITSSWCCEFNGDCPLKTKYLPQKDPKLKPVSQLTQSESKFTS